MITAVKTEFRVIYLDRYNFEAYVLNLSFCLTTPSAAILDSQSVKNAMPAAIEVGCDAAKQVKGRKRHVLVDTLGLVLMVMVTAASAPERAGVKQVFAQLVQVRHRVSRSVLVWVDEGYQREDFKGWVMDTYCWIIELVKRPETAKGFALLPRRWVMEQTFG